jgi:sn-glycerol 3-phosphate transport system ATP-binding protein
MAQVRLSALKKVFGSNAPAVDVDELRIEDGEFLTLLGPSGCGKSTLLRMLAGLETPSSGRIMFDEQVVTDLDPAERNIAMVFQNYALYPHMTVAENVGYPLKKRGVPKAERERRIREIAEMLKIDMLLDRRAAAARRARPRHDPRSRRLPVRRAAFQPRRGPALLHAQRADPPACQAARHHGLRDA